MEVETMTKLLDPKNDVVFQKLFGMKINKWDSKSMIWLIELIQRTQRVGKKNINQFSKFYIKFERN